MGEKWVNNRNRMFFTIRVNRAGKKKVIELDESKVLTQYKYPPWLT